MSDPKTDGQRAETARPQPTVEVSELTSRAASQPPDVETEEGGPFGKLPEQQAPDPDKQEEAQTANANQKTDGEEAVKPSDAETDGDEDSDGDESTAEQRPPKRSWRNRAKKLAKRLDEKDAEIGGLKQRLAALENGQGETTVGAVKSPEKPSPEDYDSHEDYTEALADWVYRRNERRSAENGDVGRSADAPESAGDADLVTRYREEYLEEVAIGKGKYDDFEAVVQNPKLALPPSVFREAMESDQPAEVLYYLGKHPEVAAEIAQLDTSQIARRIGRIEAAVANAKRSPAKESTNAPPVIVPGESAKGGDVDLERADMDTYFAVRRRQERASRR